MGQHLYTTNVAEKRRALADGYQDQTATTRPMYVFPRPLLYTGLRAVALHRLHNARTGDHLFTADPQEAARALRHQGYSDQNRLDSLWLMPSTSPAAPDSVPLLRLWNRELGDHFYTTDGDEASQAVLQHGYRRERSTVRVLTAPVMAEGILATRLHRLRRP